MFPAYPVNYTSNQFFWDAHPSNMKSVNSEINVNQSINQYQDQSIYVSNQ